MFTANDWVLGAFIVAGISSAWRVQSQAGFYLFAVWASGVNNVEGFTFVTVLYIFVLLVSGLKRASADH